jgi:hypothetical protein
MICPICNTTLNVDFNTTNIKCSGNKTITHYTFNVLNKKFSPTYSLLDTDIIIMHRAFLGIYKITYDTLSNIVDVRKNNSNNKYVSDFLTFKTIRNASYDDFLKYCNKIKLWTTFS